MFLTAQSFKDFIIFSSKDRQQFFIILFHIKICCVAIKLFVTFSQIILSVQNYNTPASIGRPSNNWPILGKFTYCLPLLLRKILTLKKENTSFPNLLKKNVTHGCRAGSFLQELSLNAPTLIELSDGPFLKYHLYLLIFDLPWFLAQPLLIPP